MIKHLESIKLEVQVIAIRKIIIINVITGNREVTKRAIFVFKSYLNN